MQLSSFMGAPITIGDNNNADKLIAFNKLLSIDVELEPMARFQIGAIPDQTVWHEGDITIGFYVLTDTLQADNVALNYSIDFPPRGKIIFEKQTGRFKYFPDKADVRDFTATFTAQSGVKTIAQDVKFTLMAVMPPEYSKLGVTPKSLPASSDKYYRTIATTSQWKEDFNSADKTVYTKSISGKDLIFDSSIAADELQDLHNASNLYELNLYAERVIIRQALHFPQTNVTIYAKELIFEDLPGQAPASINTTPLSIGGITNDNGVNGAKAGDITLYIKNYKQTKSHLRFVAIGGKGQNSNRNGTPGSGGDGGTVTSMIDISGFCDLIHGSAGIGTENDVIIKAGQKHGNDGKFVLHNKEFTWLHPNFISAIVKHAKDAYLNLNNSYAYNYFTEYIEYLKQLQESDEWKEFEEAEKIDLSSIESEMKALSYRLGQNLDYFGNPEGWVPMLSFEVNKTVFESEIEKAIRIMYLSYWLNEVDRSNAERIAGANDAVNLTIDELRENEERIETLVFRIPELEDQLTALKIKISDITLKIEQKQQELEAKAKNNIKKKNRFNKIASGLKAIASIAPVIPVVGTAVSIAANIGATAISLVNNYADDNRYSSFYDEAYTYLQEIKNKSESAAEESKEVKKGEENKDKKAVYQKVNENVTSIMKDVMHLHDIFSKSSAPKNEVEAELNRLLNESKEFKTLENEFKVLTNNAAEVAAKCQNTISEISNTGKEIQKNIASIDGLTDSIFTGNSKRDLRAMLYLDDMDRRARERLLKYHYYMAKSYEYRLLEEYKIELNLTKMFDKFKEIATADPNKKILDSDDFNTLKAVYEDALSTVKKAIIDKYNTFGSNEFTTIVYIPLTDFELDALNSGNDVIVNLVEKGFIYPNRENLRIVDINVQVKAHPEGNKGSIDNFTLKLEHSGISMLRQNGEFYYFNHINPEKNASIQWNFDYEAGNIKKNGESAASISLISSLLGVGTGEMMIYSRPGVWADIRITKDVLPASKNMVLDSLIVKLGYDYTERPTQSRNLDVYAREKDDNTTLMPYIEVSRTDKNGRSDGRNLIYRTYNRDTDVTLTAPAGYGSYQFVNWTDRYDAVISSSLSVNTKLTNDVALIANYKYTGAVLKTADTIYISSDAATTLVKVENLGSEEMEWTAVGNDPWLRITSGESGMDDGHILLEYDENLLEARTGSLTITTKDGEQSATVYIIQQESSLPTGINENILSRAKIYPNPATDKLYIENCGATEILVTDALGRFIYHTFIIDAGNIPTRNWNSGLYLVTLKTAKDSSVYKIVKK
jgi:predicted  nucleic acid-binding Zn-ribbon protein